MRAGGSESFAIGGHFVGHMAAMCMRFGFPPRRTGRGNDGSTIFDVVAKFSQERIGLLNAIRNLRHAHSFTFDI